MKFEDWKEIMVHKPLNVLLLTLIQSYDRYIKENQDKWEALRHTSALTENFKETVEWEKEEDDYQRERYEWLLEYIADKYGVLDNIRKEKCENETN